jgi:hypothetical protein
LSSPMYVCPFMALNNSLHILVEQTFPLRMSTSNVTVGMLVIAGCAYWGSGALPRSC